MLWSIIGIVVAGGVAAFLTWERHDMARALIEGNLRGRRATKIRVSPQWLDSDRGTLSFEVSYVDAEGRPRHVGCKVATRADSDDALFWSEPL